MTIAAPLGGISSLLRPITPMLSKRYDRSSVVQLSRKIIAPGLYSTNDPNSNYLPSNWLPYTHPEGQLYFYHNSNPRVLTEAYIYDVVVMKRILRAADNIKVLLSQSGLTMTDSMEAFLELDDESGDSCGYYVVDHRCHMVFWLEKVSTEDLDIRDSASTSHFRLALEANYWTHIEHFPLHLGGLSSQCLDDLVSILIHGRADRMTSDTSTCPYTATQCAEFLELLSVSQIKKNTDGLVTDGSVISFIGRLRSVLVNSRFEDHYGQANARLSSDQRLLGPPNTEEHWLLTAMSRLLFHAPEAYRQRFENLWIDEIVHVDKWRRFMSTSLSEWKETVSWGIKLLIAHVLLFSSPAGLSPWNLLSAFLCGLGVLLGVSLLHEMQSWAEANAAEAAAYLLRFNHPRFGFRPVSLLYSFPRALFQWGLGAFVCELIIMLVQMFMSSGPLGLIILLAAIAFLGLILSLLLLEQNDYSHSSSIWRRLFPQTRIPESEI